MRSPVRGIVEQVVTVSLIGTLAWGALLTFRPARVAGASMSPALEAGDLVLVRRGDPVAVHDIVLFQERGHGAVLHRVIGRRGGALRTKGDANSVADRDPVPSSAVIGSVRAIIPVGKMIAWWRAR